MKTSIKKTFTITLLLFLTQSIFSQNFQRSYFKNPYDLNHFNLETYQGATFISGTKFDGNSTEGIVARIDNSGNMIWQKTISDNSQPSNNIKILDLAIDESEGVIAVTGYTSSAPNSSKLLFITLDMTGNVLTEKVIATDDPISVGSNILYSTSEDVFIIGGFVSPVSQNLLANNSEIDVEFQFIDPQPCAISDAITTHSILFKISKTGTLLSPIKTYYDNFGADVDTSSINDIIETNTGYFIVGSRNCDIEVMAIDLDFNLSPIADYSFTNSNRDHLGTSAAYNSSENIVYVLSNSSYQHAPLIHTFDLSSTGLNSYHFEQMVDPGSSYLNFAGFQIKYNATLEKLVFAGYKREVATVSGIDGLTWICALDILPNGTIDISPGIFPYYLYNAPVGNFYYHGGGYLSSFLQESPLLFTQEILEISANGPNLAFKLLAPREINGVYGIDLISDEITSSGLINACFTKGDVRYYSHQPPYGESINQLNKSGSVENRSFLVNDFSFDVEMPCASQFRLKNENRSKEHPNNYSNLTVFPNPSNNGTVEVSFESENPESIHYKILDLNGKVVVSRVFPNKTKFRIDLTHLEKGIYLLNINDASSFKTEKIILY